MVTNNVIILLIIPAVMKMVTIAEASERERAGTLVPCELLELNPAVGRDRGGFEGTFHQISRNVK